MTACLATPRPRPDAPATPGVHLRRAIALMRTGAAALEARRSAEAVRALGAAVDHLVWLRLALGPERAPDGQGPLAAACVRAARRLTDAALLGDAALAREAERAVAPLLRQDARAGTAR
ncbi:hypothetical protein [Anaeromyxobacter dehalogenans]|uniref:hypothetical protein n=1 Tax=Anaeromyxobacter dehalogenans TaxID=161493 RepID=UPI00031726F2|nr:hypothetical protein [Anaeromyxobacter dehalogenans]